jgi:hypothetical protein
MQKNTKIPSYALKSITDYLYGFSKGAKIPRRAATQELRNLQASQ